MAGDVTHAEGLPFRIYEDSVVTKMAVQSDGKTLPVGSLGYVIDVGPIEGYYGIEFLEPFHAVVFMFGSDLALAP